ncbi:cytochrome P450 2J4-like [Amphiura filiformis]|uniref:cytochrome P450 2J4-like n=1 Tax=Amphiura filiformis TaxID=82378 RepID=UPI003B21141E
MRGQKPAARRGSAAWYHTGITFNSGPSWKELRQFTTGVLRSFGVGKRSYEDHVLCEAGYLIEYITNLEGASFDPSNAISNTVTNSVCSVVLGFRYNFDDPTYQKLLQCLEENTRLSGGSFLLNVLPASSFFFKKTQQTIVNNLCEYKRIFQPIIDEHRRNLNPDDLNDFLSVYLNECKVASDDDKYTDINEKHLVFLIVQLFAAGTGTVASTLRWAFLLVTKSPDVQRQVQEELDKVVGRSRLPKLSDRPNLPYTEATLLEVQRFGSIVPLCLPHCAGSTTTFQV